MKYLDTKLFILSLMLFFVSVGCVTQLKVSDSISKSYDNYMALEASGIYYKSYEVQDWYDEHYLTGYQGEAVAHKSTEKSQIEAESPDSEPDVQEGYDFPDLKDPRLHYNHRHYIWGEGFGVYFALQLGRSNSFYHNRGLSAAGHWYFSPTGHWFYNWHPFYDSFVNTNPYDSYWGATDYAYADLYNSYTHAEKYRERYRNSRRGYNPSFTTESHRYRVNSSAVERSSTRKRSSSVDNARVRSTGRSSAGDGSTGRSRGSSEGGDSRSRGGS
ncbi:hypothetical protein [Gracilimonas sp.]|uniref:hypothetical protein n=1 Tax=Gracilimonas sp. TaxID=1974203 RepID=UPI003D1422BB